MSSRRDTTRRVPLIILTIIVWTLAIMVAEAGRMKLASRAPTTVNLTTWPPAVRIAVDGEKQHGGAYVVTPTKLTLTPGEHKLTLSRDGYFAQSSTINDTSGRTYDMANVVLQRDAAMSFAAVEIETAPGDAPVAFQIDDGFTAGETPALIDDLLADQPHVLTLSAADQGAKSAPFRCRFAAPVPEPGQPSYLIKIKAQGGSFKVTNCTRLKKK